jgi:hypothetical protein
VCSRDGFEPDISARFADRPPVLPLLAPDNCQALADVQGARFAQVRIVVLACQIMTGTNASDPSEEILTLREFCARLKVGPKTVYRLRKKGLRYLALNSRIYRFYASDAERLLREAQVRAGGAGER